MGVDKNTSWVCCRAPQPQHSTEQMDLSCSWKQFSCFGTAGAVAAYSAAQVTDSASPRTGAQGKQQTRSFLAQLCSLPEHRS